MLSIKPWRAEVVLQFCGALLFCWCLGITSVVLLHAFGVAGFRQEDSLGVLVLSTMSVQGAAWILAFVFLKLHNVGWREALGLHRPKWGKYILFAIGVMLLAFPVVMLVGQISAMTLDKLGWPVGNQRVVEMVMNAKNRWTFGYLAFFAVVLAPAAEEFIFRGILFPFMKQLGRPKLAWLGVSLLFALIHVDAARFVPLFVLGLVLTWIYQKTDCLLASITAHSLFNTINLVLLHFNASINDYLEKHLHLQPLT